MLKVLVSAVQEVYSGQAAKQQVAAISQFHRIQASPGFRAAAQYCLQQLSSWGVEAEILSFPANEHTTYWTEPLFQEWDASEATLDLLLPTGERRRLADFRVDPISLIQRSLPFTGEAEVAVVAGGSAEADYDGLDVAGKVVLAQGDIQAVYRLAVQERGAIGILYDGMRETPPVRARIDLPDDRQYTSFWWRLGEQPRCFGFVLTPRQGDELRALARRGPLRVWAHVDARLYEGQLEVVSALIRGHSDEEVVVVAHLCHPRASANDNASGAAALLELAHTLRTLIDAGRLALPQRSIRLLWVPEMTGTVAYLATHEEEIGRMVAGLNLDMIGQNQALCDSVFVIERPPEAAASFAGDLIEALRDRMQESGANPGGWARYPLYRQAVTPFMGGSDHMILSDPAVGVPTPMLIQWPDKFYHTSADTLDKVDAGMLAVIGGLATAYAYFVAAAGEQEGRWLAGEIVARAQAALARVAQDGYTRALEAGGPAALKQACRRLEQDLAFRAGRAQAALETLLRLSPALGPAVTAGRGAIRRAQQQAWAAVQPELDRLARAQGVAELEPVEPWGELGERVWRRQFRGPLTGRTLEARAGAADRVALQELARTHAQVFDALLLYLTCWMDGRRSLREIADLVECETGLRDVGLMTQLVGILERAGLIRKA